MTEVAKTVVIRPAAALAAAMADWTAETLPSIFTATMPRPSVAS